MMTMIWLEANYATSASRGCFLSLGCHRVKSNKKRKSSSLIEGGLRKVNDNILAFDSSLTVEQIEANFTGINLYEQIMKALREALEYERKSKPME